MKKTFLAILMAGGSMAMFAQTTPTTTPTTPTTTPTTPTTPTTTTDPMRTTTTTDLNSNTNNQVTTSTSTSWAPGTSPYWGWNSYGLWNTSMYPTTNINSTTSMDNGNLNSNSSHSASGTSVTTLPYHVQTNFPKDYPTSVNQTYAWNQYGDWFQTHYVANARLIQYYYNARGMGYSLALPVIQTYVPEEIIEMALMKYGANLYSVSMVKTADGDAYQLGLMERGQLRMEYLKEDGSSVTNIWRVEEVIPTTDANATMDSQNNTEVSTTTEPETKSSDEQETKMKWKENGEKTKIKSGDGKVKIKQKKVDD